MQTAAGMTRKALVVKPYGSGSRSRADRHNARAVFSVLKNENREMDRLSRFQGRKYTRLVLRDPEPLWLHREHLKNKLGGRVQAETRAATSYVMGLGGRITPLLAAAKVIRAPGRLPPF